MVEKDEVKFCPLIKQDCKKEKCQFWRMDDCSMASYCEMNVMKFYSEVAMLEAVDEQKKEEQEKIDYSSLEKGIDKDFAQELVNFSIKEVPKQRYLSNTIKHMFWDEKKLYNKYDFPSELKLKAVRIEKLAENLLIEQLDVEEKKRLESAVENCLKWAKENDMLKLTKPDINAYVMDSGESFTQASKDILYSKVNMKLRSQ